MDLFHQTWFWVVIIVGPIGAVIGILARLAKREPPPDLPPSVKPLGVDDEDEDDDWGHRSGHGPATSTAKGTPSGKQAHQ